VVCWATFGAAWLAFALVGWGRWVLSDRSSPQPKGPDRPSTAHETLIHGHEQGTEEPLGIRTLLPKDETGEIPW
jgi:hypothetical protein